MSFSNLKEIKYDRQLRLWGDTGQDKLEHAKICLLNSDSLGAEILKNLVLPGVGEFTIVDDAKISDADLDTNFFVDQAKLGETRGRCVRDYLVELNPDVSGHVIDKNLNDFCDNEKMKEFFDQFKIVIGSNLPEKTCLDIGEYLWNKKIPFILCKCYGLLGYLRVVLPEHHVIETHPDFKPPSFQLDRIFPDFQVFVDSFDLKSMNHEQHSHVPYVVLLAKALEIFRLENRLDFPQNYEDKKKLKKILLDMRMPDEKGNLDEENFQEAINNVVNSVVRSHVPENLKILFADRRLDHVTEKSDPFWILLKSLKIFIVDENFGMLPIRGDLPDMICDSKNYVRLQNVFFAQAEKQTSRVREIARDKFACDQLTSDECRAFCKNAAFIRIFETISLREEFKIEYGPSKFNDLYERMDDKTFLAWYATLRACERFFAEKARFPGTNGIPQHLDKNDLRRRILDFCQNQRVSADDFIEDHVIDEMCRYGAAQLHCVAALVGAAAAQEAIKLVAKQYAPLNNTFLYDGNTGSGGVFEF